MTSQRTTPNPNFRRRSSSSVRFRNSDDLSVNQNSPPKRFLGQSPHNDGTIPSTVLNGLLGSSIGLNASKRYIRPATTGFQSRNERRLASNLDISHVNQQTMPLHLKEKQQISSLLPNGFILTRDLNDMNEIRKYYKKLEIENVEQSQLSQKILYENLNQDDSFIETEDKFNGDAFSNRNNQRFKVLDNFEIIHERFTTQNFHPQLKARHTDDLFQISHFLIREQAQLIHQVDDLKRENSLLSQKVQNFEQMHKSDHDLVVSHPSQDDLKQLKESVKVLRKEIAEYSQSHMKEIVEQLNSESNSKQSDKRLEHSPLRDNEYITLLHQKFELLEDFIIGLKKKIHSLEQVDEDVKKLGQDFGDVSNLIQENESLRADRHVLQWMKKRFDHEQLLKLEHTKSTDVKFLQSLTFALQRELVHCRETLRFYNFEENSSLKLAITLENGPLQFHSHENAEYSTLRSLMNSLFSDTDISPSKSTQNNDNTQLYYTETKAFVDRNTNEILKQENEYLHEQVKRHVSELEETRKLLSLLESQYKGESNSRFELKEIEITARRMMEQLHKVNSTVTSRENAFVSQQKIVDQINEDRMKKDKEIASLTEKLLQSTLQQKNLRSKLHASHNSISSLFTLSNSLIHLFVEDENTRKRLFGSASSDQSHHIENIISFLYRDLYHVFIQSTQAAVKIQSLWRGVQTRRKLLKNGHYNIIIKNPNKKRPESLDPLIKQRVLVSSEALDASNKLQLSIQSKDLENNLNRNLEVVRMLQQVILISDSDTKKLSEIRNQLTLIKGILMNEFKSQVIEELNTFKDYFQKTSNLIYSSADHVSSIPKLHRSIQTDMNELKHKPIQVGEAQFSNTVVKSFHASIATGTDPKSKK